MTEINELRTLLAAKQLLVIAGTGVTAAATNGAPTASWIGLIKDGVAKVESLGRRDPAWAARAIADAESQYESDLIAAAEKTTDALDGRASATYELWLKDAVGGLAAVDTTLLDGIKALHQAGALVVTTNYDDLLEKHLGVGHVTWRNGPLLQRVVRDGDEVVHVHGHWTDPESVVFGASSYADVMRDAAAVAFLRTMVYTRSVLFIGFGAGLRDPNFTALRDWMTEATKGSIYNHYRLVRATDVVSVQAEHSGDNVIAVPFGDDYNALGPYLSALAAAVTSGGTRGLESFDADGVMTTTGRPLPVRRDTESKDRLLALAARLQKMVDVAESDDDQALEAAGSGENLDSIRRFVTIFSEEINEVLIVAERPDRFPDSDVQKAATWAVRLESIASSADG